MGDFLADVAAGRLEPIYLLLSEEPLLLDRAVTAIRDAALSEIERGFNYEIIDGKGASAATILGAATTLPMMAARRMVLVRGIDKVAKGELSELCPYLESPNPSTVFCGVGAAANKTLKFFKAAHKRKLIHELRAPRQPAPWIRAEVSRRGLDVDAGAVRRLAEVVGSDLARLEGALDQLALYAGDRAVTSEDVDELIAETRERDVFELIDAVGSGDIRAALAAVAALSDQRQSAIGLIMMLARHMRQLGLYHDASQRGLGKRELPRAVGVPPFLVDKLGRQARHYSPAAVERGLELLSAADRDLKGGSQTVKVLGRTLGERILLDRLVSRLVGLRR